jgi:TatD DNase family protein
MIDTHAHYYVETFDTDREEALQRAVEAGVTRILTPAVSSETHAAMISMCLAHPTLCLPMMGLHPTDVDEGWERELEIVEKYLADPPVEKFYAIGETGIDLHWSRDHFARQTAAFERQIELALRYDLPLDIHSRDAWPETFAVLERYAGTERGRQRLRGAMHAFSGTVEDYRRACELGDFLFGVTGVVTYKKNHWRALLPEMDTAHILLETDAPWLPPEPFRGRRNESTYLPYIRDAVAALVGLAPEEVERITTLNAKRLFGLD